MSNYSLPSDLKCSEFSTLVRKSAGLEKGHLGDRDLPAAAVHDEAHGQTKQTICEWRYQEFCGLLGEPVNPYVLLFNFPHIEFLLSRHLQRSQVCLIVILTQCTMAVYVPVTLQDKDNVLRISEPSPAKIVIEILVSYLLDG